MNASLARVRYLLIANLFFLFALAPFINFTVDYILLSIAMYFVVDCLGVVITYHRYWSHKSFKFKSKIIKYLFSSFAVMSGTGSALGWAGIHKLHHKHSDTIGEDPHEKRRGFFDLFFLNYNLNERKMVRQVLNISKDPFIKYTNRYWVPIMATYIAAIFATFGLQGLYFIFIVPALMVMFSQTFTNYINHSKGLGYRNHDTKDNSHNCIWLSALNWGEGWHNNHHANPAKSNLREKWWEVDISGMIINVIKAK